MDDIKLLLDEVLADKAVGRLQARTLAWPANVEVIGRLGDKRKSLRATMKVVRRRTSASEG